MGPVRRFERATVEGLSARLRSFGWKIPKEERIGLAAGLDEIRYRSDADRPAADLLAADIERAQTPIRGVRVRKIGIIKPGSLELWVSQ